MDTIENRVLGVFAKWPAPGRTKTRLASETSPEWAAEVALAFLKDTLQRLASVQARKIIVFGPAEERAAFSRLAQTQYELVPQAGGDLGERLESFFELQFAGGARQVVVVGTDSPTMPVPRIAQALECLDHADLVLGPATDGGYYLVGSRVWPMPIFSGVGWGGNRVLGETVARIEESGLRLALLEPWYDVDTLADWHMLRGHLQAQRAAGEKLDLEHTLRLCEL